MSSTVTNARKIILPKKGEKNVLITSALPYVNNVPHLGNIVGAILSADVYARFCRQRGMNVIYICGTDEYGTATETKALQEGVTPQEICDKYYELHRKVYEWFDISFDYFGRTTTEKQTKIAQDIFLKIYKNNLLEEKIQKQLFCPTCLRFLADRYVVGTCPKCGYEDARGDQCDKCQALLNPEELIEPKCHICRTSPIFKDSKHLFLNLPKLSQQIEDWKNSSYKSNCWSSVATSITDSWLKQSLQPRCITRDLKWGTKVPLEGFENKVFYVWFDAPIGYISITANYTDDWEQWWKNKEEVDYVQFMGKDNVPFHSIIFPGSLMATGESWTLVNKLSATEYLNYEFGAKFSKRRNIGVFGDAVMQIGISPDIFRYYLMRVRPETQDSEFNWDDFGHKANDELLKNFGNFVNRTLKFVQLYFDSVVPDYKFNDQDLTFIGKVNAGIKEYLGNLNGIKLRDALSNIMMISQLGNLYLTENGIGKKLLQENKERCSTIVYVACQMAHGLISLMEPYMPSLKNEVLRQMNLEPVNSLVISDELNLKALPSGHKIGKPKPLFEKIESSLLLKLREKYQGEKTFSLNLKVGKILDAQNIQGADSLWKLSVDLGETKPKTIIAGIKKQYSAESLKDKLVIVVCNIAIIKKKDVHSEGMLLTLTDTKNKDVCVLLSPQTLAKAGDALLPTQGKVQYEPTMKKPEVDMVLSELKVVLEKNNNGALVATVKFGDFFLSVNGGNNKVFADLPQGRDGDIADETKHHWIIQ